ncbi:MAG: transglutaminase domain-containing protein [Verrucomicrobiota bacterium]
MKTPRFLLGAALCFWGWQTGLLIWSVPMAVILEASLMIPTRWEFSLADLKRIWNLCAVLFFGATVILYSSEEARDVALKFVQWLPFSFYPIILAQIYGSAEKLPLTVFSWFLRRSPERPLAKKTINISFLYFGICLLAASATNPDNQNSSFFYRGMALLVGLALLTNRPRRLPQPVWILLIVGVAMAGQVGHQQLHTLHAELESGLARWFVRFFHRQPNINESRTSIGKIGRIQLSREIVLRVKPESSGGPPGLLRDASYDVYKNGVWRSSQIEFERVFVETNDVALLQPPHKLNSAVQIAGYLHSGRGQLALPHGAYELSNLPVVLYTNRLGLAKVEEGPGLLNMVAKYGRGPSCDSLPSDADLYMGPKEKPTIAEVARSLNLEGKSEREKIEAIRRFFQDGFSYSLEITRKHIDPSGQKTPLGQFLTVARSGHCEYFASATVLLLREAKIPARYATGYAVDDSQRKGKTYLVRERDAHAWALVYREDKRMWEELDTTPASIERTGKVAASALEPISDFFSNLKFQFSKWRWSKTSYTAYLKWLLVPLIGFLVWRILSNQRRQQKVSQEASSEPAWPGMDSEVYLLEIKLTAAGLGRGENEPLRDWQKRLSSTGAKNLEGIFDLHRRLRFDPRGVTNEDRQVLTTEVKHWLDAFESNRQNFHPPIQASE